MANILPASPTWNSQVDKRLPYLVLFDTGSSFSAACQSGEREGTTPHIPASVADGERRPQAHEPQLLPNGKSCDCGALSWRLS